MTYGKLAVSAASCSSCLSCMHRMRLSTTLHVFCAYLSRNSAYNSSILSMPICCCIWLVLASAAFCVLALLFACTVANTWWCSMVRISNSAGPGSTFPKNERCWRMSASPSFASSRGPRWFRGKSMSPVPGPLWCCRPSCNARSSRLS